MKQLNYVIIGNSAAAVGAVEGIRKEDKKGDITIISEELYHTYSKPLISYWLEGKVTDDKIYYRGADFYEKNNCKLILGKKAASIDADNKAVILSDNSKVNYDKLLVATGSRPFIPPSEGYDLVKNKFTFMWYDDAKALKEKLTPNSRVLIIGAGLIGLKCAEGVYKTTKNITVVDLSPRILSSILDEEGAQVVKEHIEAKGVNFILGNSVKAFTENSATTKSGTVIPFDILVMAVGVKPNVELVMDANGEVNRGIVTDEFQKTSIADVFAAGDCTESVDITSGQRRILALLPNAYMQGEVAGLNMAGKKSSYDNAIAMNAIGFFGLHMITAGSYDGEIITSKSNSEYKKFFIKDNLLKGYILIDKIARAGIYTSLIKEQIPLSLVNEDLLFNQPQMLIFNKERRVKKLGGVPNAH